MGIVPKSGVENGIGQGEVVLSNFINSTPELKECRRCRGWVLEAHIFGWATRVDANPVTLSQELEARLFGRKVYQITGEVEKMLTPRRSWHIQTFEASGIHLEHHCSTPDIFQPIPDTQSVQPKEPQF